MEYRHDMLDEIEETEEFPVAHRQRSFRFLLYAIGLALVLFGRLWWSSEFTHEEDILDSRAVRRLFALGIAGIWLFSGLGSLSGIRAFKLGERDLLLVSIIIVHLLLLMITTGILASVITSAVSLK